MRCDAERVCDEMSGISLGPSGCRDRVGTGVERVITVAQAIAMNPQASIPVQTSHNPTQSIKAADPKPFNGNRDQTEEFIRAIRIAVTMQANTFVDERMKILYALSFMHGGTAQVWAANEHVSHNQDISDADIGHLSGKC